MKIKVSAPGKLMLFGEHAVVYQRPCLVTSVSSRIYIETSRIRKGLLIDAPQVKDIRFVKETVKVFKEKYPVDGGLKIKTFSDFKRIYGFGSSSAVTVATIYGLSKLYQIKMSRKEIFDLGYKVTLNIQGVGSGFDIAAAVYGKTLYFITGGKLIKPLVINQIPMVVGFSGVKADTPKIVKDLKLKIEKDKNKFNKIFDQIAKIVIKAKRELAKGHWLSLGELMNQNHRWLQKLGVSTRKLDRMCQKAVEAGAYGAKLSGAGGGDCMIALVSPDKKSQVEAAINQVGGEVINVFNNTEGVRLEYNKA